MAPPPPPSINPGVRLEGKYRIVRVLSALGSTADLYEAFDESLKRPVAVKVLKRQRRTSVNRRLLFEAEARRTGGLGVLTSAVTTVYAFGEDDLQRPYIVMELLRPEEGWRPMNEWIDLIHKAAPNFPLYFRRDVRWRPLVRCFIDALEPFVPLGWVHRDIKPTNVFVQHDEQLVPRRIKLIDLGLMTHAKDPPSYWLMECGTPGYIAPEQLRGTPPSPESDAWSVGVTLHVAALNTPAFENQLVQATRQAMKNKDRAALRMLADQYGPPALSQSARLDAAGLLDVFYAIFDPIPGGRLKALKRLLADAD